MMMTMMMRRMMMMMILMMMTVSLNIEQSGCVLRPQNPGQPYQAITFGTLLLRLRFVGHS